nr:hypothetical protein [Angustibacter aerolatus]
MLIGLYLRDQSVAQVADEPRPSPGTVKSRSFYALRKPARPDDRAARRLKTRIWQGVAAAGARGPAQVTEGDGDGDRCRGARGGADRAARRGGGRRGRRGRLAGPLVAASGSLDGLGPLLRPDRRRLVRIVDRLRRRHPAAPPAAPPAPPG